MRGRNLSKKTELIDDDEVFRPMVYATPADNDDFKGYPNGIRVTFAAIWQQWAKVDRGDTRTKTSAAEFAELYGLPDLNAELAKKYPFAPPAPGTKGSPTSAKVAGEEFQKFGGSKLTDNKSLNLSYMTLRRAASVVKLPVGLLLLFTNLISQERRARKLIAHGAKTSQKSELLALIGMIEKFAAEARLIVDEAEDDDIFFNRFGPGEWLPPSKNAPRTDEEVYIADLTVLKRLRDACRSGKL